MSHCPCGNAEPFASCCEPFIKGEPAPSPEKLMRSRYSAYTTKQIDYIQATTDPQTRVKFDRRQAEAWASNVEFTRLEILQASEDGSKGQVEFRAHFRNQDGTEETHHEFSKFRKMAGVWYFRDGKVMPPPAEGPV